MAKSADGGRVAADIRAPNFRSAVSCIRSIVAKKLKIGSVNGEISDIWAKVEGEKVHKVAGKFFARLDSMEGPERLDVMRSLNGLCDAADWPKEDGDMVDQAENKVVPLRVGKQKPKADGDDDGDGDGNGDGDGDGDGDQESDQDENETEREEEPDGLEPSAVKPTGIAGLDKARQHFGGGRK